MRDALGRRQFGTCRRYPLSSRTGDRASSISSEMRFEPGEFRPVPLEDYRELLDDYVAWLWANFYQRIFPEWTTGQQARARDIDALPESLRNVLTGILTGLSSFTANMLDTEISQARFTIEEQFPGLIDSLSEWGPMVLRDFRAADAAVELQAAEVYEREADVIVVDVAVKPEVAEVDESQPGAVVEPQAVEDDESREPKAVKSKKREEKQDRKRRKEEKKRVRKREKKEKKREKKDKRRKKKAEKRE